MNPQVIGTLIIWRVFIRRPFYQNASETQMQKSRDESMMNPAARR